MYDKANMLGLIAKQRYVPLNSRERKELKALKTKNEIRRCRRCRGRGHRFVVAPNNELITVACADCYGLGLLGFSRKDIERSLL